MNTQIIEKKFSQMGVRVKISEPRNRWGTPTEPFSIDVKRDNQGPFFDLRVKDEVELMILDVQKNDKHLLLMSKEPTKQGSRNVTRTAKFLCGHDERDWFTCAVPQARGIPVSTVIQAKQALKPVELQDIERHEGIRAHKAQKRHRKLKTGRKIHRQGEFMFIPEFDFQPPKGSLSIIHRNEPMQRGAGSKPHYAEELYRVGGHTVYVSDYSEKSKNEGLTQGEYNDVMKKDTSNAKRFNWETRVRNPKVMIRGRITHKDHKTLDLGTVWHRLLINTENLAFGAKNVAFLD